MTMKLTKVTTLRPANGKPRIVASYYLFGRWRRVKNADNKILVYPSRLAAERAAKWYLDHMV